MSRKRRFQPGAYLSDIPGCQKILVLKRGSESESVVAQELCAVTPGSNCSLTTTYSCFVVGRCCKSSLALVNSHPVCLSPVRILNLVSLNLIVSMYIKYSHVWIKVLHFLRNISKTSASVSSGFQTRENWWKHEAAGRVLLLFSSVWNSDETRSMSFWNCFSNKRKLVEISITQLVD